MERFDIQSTNWSLKKRDDGFGAFTWADEAISYQQSYRASRIWNIVLALACAILSAYLVYHQHDPQPVQVSEEEYRAAQQQAQQAQTERAALLRRIEDLGAIRRNLVAQLRTQNANNVKLVRQLKEVQASVPPLPIIEASIRKEAATEKGLRQAVARNFGGEIASRVRVVEP